MIGLIPYPTTAKKLPRSWAQGVTDAANAVRRIGGAGLLVRDMGPIGGGSEPLPANQRDRRGALVADLGCFRIETETRTEDGETETVHVFGNQYYRFGDMLHQSAIATTVEELLADAGTADSDGVMPLFIALRISSKPGAPTEDANGDPLPRVEGFGSLSALSQAQGDLDFHVLPIYLLDVVEDPETGERSWTVRCDFRRGVMTAQQWEDLST